MAGKSLGVLTLDLIAKTGGWTTGMTQAERATDKLSKKVAKERAAVVANFKAVTSAAMGIGAALGTSALLSKFIQESKDAQAEQAQLAAVLKSTANAAGYSQQKLNAMADAMSGKSIFDAGEINTAQTRLLSYTGVVGDVFPRAMQNAIDMATRMGTDVAQAAETVGKALDVPSQGMAALSKQGFRFTDAQKDLVKQLEETGQTAKAQAIVMEAMESSYSGAAVAARDTLGGAMADLQKAIKDLMTGDDASVDGVKNAVQDLANTMRSDETKSAFASMVAGMAWVAKSAISTVNGIAALSGSIAGLMGGTDDYGKMVEQKYKKAVWKSENYVDKGQREAAAKEAAQLKKELDFLASGGYGSSQPKLDFSPDMPVTAPTTSGGSSKKDGKGASEAAARARAEFNAYLSDIKRQTAEALAVLDDRNARLDLMQDQNLLSVVSYYAQRREIEQSGLAEKIKGIDAEIAAQQQFMQTAGKDTDRIGAQAKLNDLYSERNKLQASGALELEKLAAAEAQAMRGLRKEADDVNIRLLEMLGKLGEAARLRAELGSADQIAKFELNGMTKAAANVRELNEMEAAQGRLNELKREFGLINDRLGLAEERINIARQTGASSEIQALVKAGEARRKAIADLEKQLSLYLLINGESDKPEIVAAIERMKVELEGLKAVAEPLAAQFQGIFKGSFEDAFAGLISGSKNAKDAFKDMADSIVQQISRMAAQQIATGLFSPGGIAGGLGGMVSGLFKGKGYAVGSSYIANDQVAMLHQGERVLTAKENREFTATGGLGGGMVVNNNFTLQGEVTRQTQQQLASAAAQSLTRAQRRNG